MCPWISKWQWHAFTMFPDPTKKDHTMICIGASGDWTKEMYNKIKSPCHRSLFVLGPFASEFSDMALHTTNALAIASGIGITPTLSLMLSYAGKKRINIIWMCRDAGLIEYFLHKLDIFTVTKNSFALIYYTGKEELVLPKNLPLNFFIFQYRPNLEQVSEGPSQTRIRHSFSSNISLVLLCFKGNIWSCCRNSFWRWVARRYL
jgi:ferric-chelate reductase